MLTLNQFKPPSIGSPFNAWNIPPQFLGLPDNEVHVWRAELDVPPERVNSLQQILSPDERARAERFHFQTDRDHFVVAHGLLRTILTRYLDLDPAQLRFNYGPYGKPTLTNGLGQEILEFNMSHAHGLALYGVTRGRRIGIDLEYVRIDFAYERIAERFFSAQEFAELCILPEAVKPRAFFNGWTRKEAYIKARGDGLSFPLHKFNVSLTPGKPAKLLSVLEDACEASRWLLCELEPGPGYVAALAVEGRDWQLKSWQWLDS
ncbi:MAG: 4'-phosphopantetheinyl transferase superfamily protein [Anaerolineae bacterium]|nr:4'-phosphopantetheinyl transferase superfamily protein [Anaerolineae bacterium]